MDVTVCWDETLKDCKQYKKQKYEPLTVIINDKMNKDGVTVRAIIFKMLGSVRKGNAKVFKILGILEKKHLVLFKDINCIIAVKIDKI